MQHLPRHLRQMLCRLRYTLDRRVRFGVKPSNALQDRNFCADGCAGLPHVIMQFSR